MIYLNRVTGKNCKFYLLIYCNTCIEFSSVTFILASDCHLVLICQICKPLEFHWRLNLTNYFSKFLTFKAVHVSGLLSNRETGLIVFLIL